MAAPYKASMCLATQAGFVLPGAASNDFLVYTGNPAQATLFGVSNVGTFMRVDGSGNVAFSGNVGFSNQMVLSGIQLTQRTSTTTNNVTSAVTAVNGFSKTGGAVQITMDPTSNYIGFFSSNTEYMRVNSNGYVGIGTVTPGYPLEIVGNMSLGNPSTSNVGNICAGNLGMFRNRIINGNFAIDQRFSGSSTTTSGGIYILDRWAWDNSSTGATISVGRAALPAALSGFTYCWKFTVTATGTLQTVSYVYVGQAIEGLNMSDLNWGTANASPITVSFYVYTSLTGTYSVSFRNNVGNRGYVTNFTITNANTWTYVTFTVPGDTTGTWTTDNTAGLWVRIMLVCGTAYQTTANTWSAATSFGTSSVTNSFITTNGATFHVTGFQIEKGSMATPFEFRPYGMELQLCQRYFIMRGGSWETDSFLNIGISVGNAADHTLLVYNFPVQMRTIPLVTTTGGAWNSGPSTVTITLGANGNSTTSVQLKCTGSGYTNYNSYLVYRNGNSTAALLFSAEL